MSSVRILGPVEVWAGGERLVLRGPQQLALLAVLLLRANRAVSNDVLVDALWGEERAGGRNRLQMVVMRLRQALTPLEADGKLIVRTVGSGYLLALGPGELDAEVFQDRLTEGRDALRDGEPARARELLSGALALWRGPPLAEVNYEEFAQTEIRRLEELRLLALESRVDAQLQLGHPAAVIAELEALLVEQPSRERSPRSSCSPCIAPAVKPTPSRSTSAPAPTSPKSSDWSPAPNSWHSRGAFSIRTPRF